MEVIKGGMDGAIMWRVSLEIRTTDVVKVIKAMRAALEESGGRCEVIDFYKIKN
jgi:hypothetical protein